MGLVHANAAGSVAENPTLRRSRHILSSHVRSSRVAELPALYLVYFGTFIFFCSHTLNGPPPYRQIRGLEGSAHLSLHVTLWMVERIHLEGKKERIWQASGRRSLHSICDSMIIRPWSRPVHELVYFQQHTTFFLCMNTRKYMKSCRSCRGKGMVIFRSRGYVCMALHRHCFRCISGGSYLL